MTKDDKGATNYSGLISASSNADELAAAGLQEVADDGLAEYYHSPGTEHSHTAGGDATEPGAKDR